MAPQHKEEDKAEYPQVSLSRHPRVPIALPHLAVKRPAPPPPPPPSPPPPPPRPPTSLTSMVPPPSVASSSSSSTEAASLQFSMTKDLPGHLNPSWAPEGFTGGFTRSQEKYTSPAIEQSVSTAPPYSSGFQTSQIISSPVELATNDSPTASKSPYDHRGGPPPWIKDKEHNGGIYAAAAIIPIVLLAIIGGLVLFCRRKRRRQREQQAVTMQKTEEMRMQPPQTPTAHAYMASPAIASPPYTAPPDGLLAPPPNPSIPQPVILGPIPTGANGAYFTGIDTSDVVSITSANNLRPGPPLAFSDNDSLAEPPPPYRPRSTAPPSFGNTSRQSSFRNSVTAPATSQTHLIERSLLEDPIDDDTFSSPTARHNRDSVSAVSDLSYQNDPVVARSHV